MRLSAFFNVETMPPQNQSMSVLAGQWFQSLYGSITKVTGGIWTKYGGQGWTRIKYLLPGSRFDYEREAGHVWLNPVVGLAIDWLGNRFPRPRMIVSKINSQGDHVPLPRHELIDLWKRPNRYYSRRTLEKAVGLSLKCDGNAYIYKVRDGNGKVAELWWIPHYRILPTWPPDGSSYIDGYRVWIDSSVYWLPVSDIIHIRDGIDPLNERLGICGLRSNLREVCTVNEESGFRAAILRNSGVPSIAIVPKNNNTRPQKSDAEDIRNEFLETHGMDNRGRIAVLSGEYDLVNIGYSPEQLNLVSLPVIPTARILSALGVAAMSIGLPDPDKTYCLPSSSRVWTPGGSKSIADVLPGDIVWSLDGGELVQRRVLKSQRTGNEPLVEVKTKNRILRGTASHPVLVRKDGRSSGCGNKDRGPSLEWKRLGDLTIRDCLVQPKSLPDQGCEHLPSDGLFESDEATPELMQFFGAFVGDGSMVEDYRPESYGYNRRIVVAMPKEDRVGNHYRELAVSLFRKTGGAPVAIGERPRCFQFQSMPAFRLLKRLGFAGKAKTKRVPGWVFGLSERLRLAFLAGIVDSDGSVGKDGRLTVQLCNRDLVEDIRDLCISVGIQASNIRHQEFKVRGLPNRGNRDVYHGYGFTVSSAVHVARIPFADPLYRKRVADNVHRIRSDGRDASRAGLDEHLGFYRVSQIRHLPAEDVYDIEVENSHCFIADGVVVHNSNLEAANRMSWGTIVSAQELIAEALQFELLPDFGDDPLQHVVEYDYSDVQELQEALDAIHNRAQGDFKAGIITRNEARERIGEPQIEDGDTFFPGTGGVAEDPTKVALSQREITSGTSSDLQEALSDDDKDQARLEKGFGGRFSSNGHGRLLLPGGPKGPDKELLLKNARRVMEVIEGECGKENFDIKIDAEDLKDSGNADQRSDATGTEKPHAD